MKQSTIYACVFVFGAMCSAVGLVLFVLAMSDPLTPTNKQPASYRSTCYWSMT